MSAAATITEADALREALAKIAEIADYSARSVHPNKSLCEIRMTALAALGGQEKILQEAPPRGPRLF